MKAYLLICLLAVISVNFAITQDGTLDSSFGDNGIVLYQDAGYTTNPNALMIKPNGSLLTIGERYDGFGSQLLMLGYLADGQTDESFGRNNLAGNPTWGYPGIVHTDIPGSNREYAYAGAFQPDEKILVGGYANTGGDWLLARYKPNGDLDSSFATNGFLTKDRGGFETINNVILLDDGKILASGTANFNLMVARYLPDGSPDMSFGNNGMAGVMMSLGDGGRMTVDENGRIYLCGTEGGSSTGNVVLARFLSAGDIDATFGNNGKVNIPSGELPTRAYVAMAPGNKAVVVSDYPSNFGTQSAIQISKFNPDGSPDTSFDGDGKRVVNPGDFVTPAATIVQPDGAVLVTGRITRSGAADLFVAKLRTDGSGEVNFGDNGLAVSGLGQDGFANSALGLSLALLPDENILAGGTARQSGLDNLLLVKFNNSVGETSGVFNRPKVEMLNVYPNPVDDILHIEMDAGESGIITIYDQLGKVARRLVIDRGDQTVSMKGLQSGFYTIELNSGTKRKITKIWKN